ncbi:hypothetical protein Syun_002843 [Stephania yunnanensis]|uniref:NAC domain-containing protein n=1 Tax=Stephania yunnanensis TaxID=152371 RepID=A0AAP0L0A9_9MAGN
MGSSNGGVPPGFRFHPTDEELLHYYLRKKVSFQKFDLEVIREVDLNKIEPWDLQEKCKIGSTPQNEWYFFSHKDRKYPTGSRTNRATNAGFWKATGRDKCIRNTFKKIGMRKTLVFYRGRAPHGQKTDWIMHEYRLEDSNDPNNCDEDGWVVCRVFKKKNLFKLGEGSAGVGNALTHHLNNTTTNNISNINIALSRDSTDDHYQYNNNNNNLHHHPVQQQGLLDLYNKPNNISNNNNNKLSLHYSHPNIQDYSNVTNLLPVQLLTNNDHQRDQHCHDNTTSHGNQACSADQSGGNLDHHHQHYHQEGVLNEWGVPERLVASVNIGNHEDESSGSKGGVRFAVDQHGNGSVNQMNQQLTLRGEMDFWGYAK